MKGGTHKMKMKTKVPNKLELNREKVIISSGYYTNDRPYFVCSFCNRTLGRLSGAGGNNSTYWCRFCSVEFDPESENLRKELKITVPDKNIEPAISTTPGIPDIRIHHEPEIKGAFKYLQQKGLKITNYKEDVGQGYSL
jgi:hypothetical protein